MKNVKNIIAVVSKALNSTPTGVTYFAVNGYTNQKGEKSNRVINIGAKYSNAKKKDAEYLENLDVKTLNSDMDIELLEEARVALLTAIIKPSQATKKRSKAQVDAYTKINDAIKVHNTNLALYIYGIDNTDKEGNSKKKVISKGDYGVDTRKPLTKAKDLIRKGMRTTKYRQFKVEVQPENITLSGANDTILVEVV